ncbi:hypothetical protein KC318_g7194 [Hortaea werneckii]|nr:hypothetical protein KC334_g7333 [Hortaea werneckii]KAI7007758.1 hypothetical protein KC355_g7217 [Hortaea werneckii]KAI7665304.1 hypothetical protein KC318_g7194 [Hortaea werneckii]
MDKRKRPDVDDHHEEDIKPRKIPYVNTSWKSRSASQLTREERARLRREGRCFACRKTGHRADSNACETNRFGTLDSYVTSNRERTDGEENCFETSVDDGEAAVNLLEQHGMYRSAQILREAYRKISSQHLETTDHDHPSQVSELSNMYTVDTIGYDRVPRTSARSPVRYDRLNGDSALGEELENTVQSDTPAVIGHHRDTTSESTTDQHTRPSQNHNGNCSPQHLPPDRVPGLIHEREDTPELESFTDTRPPLKLSPSDIPPGTKKIYAVRHGDKPGIYFQWNEAQAQVEGYVGNRFMSFKRLDDALDYYNHTPADCTYQNGSCCQPDLKAAEQARDEWRRCNRQQTAEDAAGLDEDMIKKVGSEVRPKPKREDLCEEQKKLVDVIISGRNTFYTGSAGTGKSTALGVAVAELRAKGLEVAIVAPTGIAALNVNGETYYTWAGWLPDSKKKPIERLMSEAHSEKRWKRLNQTDVLVIDEISMLENHQFERLDQVSRSARAPSKDPSNPGKYHVGPQRSVHDPSLPFGGIQVIVTGDFCQLPPVLPFATCYPCGRELSERGEKFCSHCRYGFQKDDQWAFRSAAWEACNFVNIELTEIHRQSDPAFIDILRTLRSGNLPSAKQRALLLDHDSDTVDAVKLFPTNREADAENEKGLAAISHPKRTFYCHDRFDWQERLHPHLKSKSYRNNETGVLRGCEDHRYLAELVMKVGMLVMLVANVDLEQGLANGTQGKLISFKKYDPRRLQSRNEHAPDYWPKTGGEGGKYRDLRAQEWVRKQDAVEAGGAAEEKDDCQLKYLPQVRFQNGKVRTIYPVCQVSALGDDEPYSLLSRTQIPLLPAWAITIHKSQGMTLDKVLINLDRSFEREMVYVALSRARGLQGLKIESRDDLRVLQEGGRLAGGNAEVKAFMRRCFGRG